MIVQQQLEKLSRIIFVKKDHTNTWQSSQNMEVTFWRIDIIKSYENEWKNMEVSLPWNFILISVIYM